ncbi:MAG: hypothetical protein ACLRRH_04530 [Clostridium sp.]
MDRTELCKQLKDGTFYFYKFGLLVKLPVAEVIDKEDFIELNFANNGGYVDVFMEYMQKVRRPGNIIAKFDWCYSLKNDYGDLIGYIGKEEDKQEKLFKVMDRAIDEAMKEEI